MSLRLNLKILVGALLALNVLPLFARDQPKSSKETITACVLSPQSDEILASQLGWAPSKKNSCSGTYRDYNKGVVEGFKVTADEVNLALDGKSTVGGHVQVLHGDKALSADLAHIYRKEGKIKEIELINHVIFNEPNHRILAKKGRFFVQDYSGSMSDLLYRLTLVNEKDSLLSTVDSLTGWGQACQAKRDAKGNVTFTQVSYSTCPPGNHSWGLKADEITLLKKESKGIAKKVSVTVKGIPFIYLPYLSFPLDTQRKSGFIGSELALTSANGFDYKFPYYLNIAPNIDATLYPHLLSRRGFMLGSEFRYLKGESNGIAELHFLPNDKAFQTFKSSNLWLAPELSTLSDNRYSFKWVHNSELTPNLFLNIDYETVSDDYYLQDFNNRLSVVSENQLLREMGLTYHTEHWVYRALVQEHQTLHPFNQSTTQGVYARLPSLTAVGRYDDLPYGFHLDMETRFDNFKWQGEAPLTVPQGVRVNASPSLSWFKDYEGVLIEPKLTVRSSLYELTHYNGQSKTISNVIPIASIDIKAQFNKVFLNGFEQTLEPHLYYLYTPYTKQWDIPNFDTALLIPSYNQLFRNNRFAGLDRVGDSNKLSFGFSSRVIDLFGIERLKLSMGGAYKFKRERVLSCQSFNDLPCSELVTEYGYTSSNAGLSPTEFEADIKLSTHINVLASLAFDVAQKQVNNGLINFHYEPKKNHIINAGFGFIVNGDPTQLTNINEVDINLKQFRLSYAWPYNAHWRSIGAWSYNLSHKFSTSYLAGLQYDDCCFAMRFLGGRVYQNYNATGAPSYGNNVYLQILLKGLGSAANNDPGGVIKNYLPTFKDEFK